MGLQNDELQCSEPDFEDEKYFGTSPNIKRINKSPIPFDNEGRYESMSFSG